jgi:hypothetical protein
LYVDKDFIVSIFTPLKNEFLNSINHYPFILLTSTKWWAPASASKWRMGFNSAFKVLI